MSHVSPRAHSVLILFLIAAILPAVVGCSESGRLLSVGNGLEYRHEAVLWVYEPGWQYVTSWQVVGPYIPVLGTRKCSNGVEDPSATVDAETGRTCIHFFEDANSIVLIKRRFPIIVDVQTGQRLAGVPKEAKAFGCLREVLGSCDETDLLGDGRYVLRYVREGGDASLKSIYVGAKDQPIETCERLLAFSDKQCGFAGRDRQILVLDDLNYAVVSPGNSELYCIDLSKLPPPVSETTQTAKSD